MTTITTDITTSKTGYIIIIKQFGIDINVNIHKKSKRNYEKNNNKTIFNKIGKRKSVKLNGQLIRGDLPSKNHKNDANNKTVNKRYMINHRMVLLEQKEERQKDEE